MKAFIVHDFFRGIAGGEKVVLTIAEAWGWPVITGEMDEIAKRDILKRKTLQIIDLTIREKTPLVFGLSQILQFWWGFYRLLSPHLKGAELVLFSGQLALLGAKNVSRRQILYCHTPPRILYDARDFMLKNMPSGKRPFMRLLLVWYRYVYEKAIKQMHLVIANSENVRRRIKHYLGLDSVVVYPPVEIHKFRWIAQENFFLSTARLDSLKRVELIVRAFLKMPDKKLVVISGGPLFEKLKRLASKASNIKIMGWVSEETLYELIGRCLATIYIPKDEDFGISPVESMAAGKPVIGVAEGGLLETIIPNETGILLPPDPSEDDLIKAVHSLTPARAKEMRPACEARARFFDKEAFLAKMREQFMKDADKHL